MNKIKISNKIGKIRRVMHMNSIVPIGKMSIKKGKKNEPLDEILMKYLAKRKENKYEFI